MAALREIDMTLGPDQIPTETLFARGCSSIDTFRPDIRATFRVSLDMGSPPFGC